MVTATRDRRRDSETGQDATEWGQRSAFGASKGWPWWGAVLLALGLSMIGAFIDMNMSKALGKVFEGAYFVGCVGAVCLVRRRNLFGPMVQAPLVLAITVPVAVLATDTSTGGTMSKVFKLGIPLVNGFPTMAITTGATLVIGGIRFLVQRKPAGLDEDDWDDRGSANRRRSGDRDPDRGADRGADRGNRAERPGAPTRRPRPAEDRPGAGRGGQARDDRGAPRDRTRLQQPPRGRGDANDRGDRAGNGRTSADRGQSRDRGQSPDRDRGQARGGRPSRDDGRRQPPRRRDDDYFD